MDIYQIIEYIVVAAVILISGYFGSYYLIFKKKLSELRQCLDAVDDALNDDSITEDEFRKIWDKCYTFFKDLIGQ